MATLAAVAPHVMPGTDIVIVFVEVSAVGDSTAAVEFSSDVSAAGPVESLWAHPMAKARPIMQTNCLIVTHSNYRCRVNDRERAGAAPGQ